MSDLEGWSRILEGNNDQEAKETQSNQEIKGKNSTDKTVEQY